jgi:virulence factor Mce-like protein
MGVLRSGRGGPTRNELALRGLMLMAVFGALVMLMSASMSGAFTDTSEVSTRLDTAGGALVPGADVKLAGLVVGEVASIEGDEEGVVLALTMDNDLIDGVPSTVKSRVLPATIFGTTYVDLVAQGRTEGRSLRAGDRIEQDTSVPTLELQRALDSVDRLVDALGPAELNSTLTSLATALDGRGAELGRTIEIADSLLAKVIAEMPLIREDLALLATNLEMISRVAPDLLDATDDALAFGGHLVERKAEFARLLTGGLALVRETDQLLSDNERALVRVLRNGAAVTNAFYSGRSGLRSGLLAVMAVTDRIRTLGTGGPLRVEGRVIQPRYGYYTASDCPRYGRARGDNCRGAGRAAVGQLVAGGLAGHGTDHQGAARGAGR